VVQSTPRRILPPARLISDQPWAPAEHLVSEYRLPALLGRDIAGPSTGWAQW
jgi:hypothetical protein